MGSNYKVTRVLLITTRGKPALVYDVTNAAEATSINYQDKTEHYRRLVAVGQRLFLFHGPSALVSRMASFSLKLDEQCDTVAIYEPKIHAFQITTKHTRDFVLFDQIKRDELHRVPT